MSDNVISFGGKQTEEVSPYHDYEIVLHKLADEQEPIVLRDYGYLINNGSFYAIGRRFNGQSDRLEFVVVADVENVRYAKAIGLHLERTGNETVN